MKQSNEPFWWSLFAAGGMLGALLTPVLIFLVGIALPLGWMPAQTLEYESVRSVVARPLSKSLLLGLIPLSLFHWAHRFRFQLIDIGVTGARKFSAVFCYGIATIGAVLTILVLWKI